MGCPKRNDPSFHHWNGPNEGVWAHHCVRFRCFFGLWKLIWAVCLHLGTIYGSISRDWNFRIGKQQIYSYHKFCGQETKTFPLRTCRRRVPSPGAPCAGQGIDMNVDIFHYFLAKETIQNIQYSIYVFQPVWLSCYKYSNLIWCHVSLDSQVQRKDDDFVARAQNLFCSHGKFQTKRQGQGQISRSPTLSHMFSRGSLPTFMLSVG